MSERMRAVELDAFLESVKERLALRPQGFRRVRSTLRRRLARRVAALGLGSLAQYRGRLEREPGEWSWLEAACRITISRFARDAAVFDSLVRVHLPELAERARSSGRGRCRFWSAGSASGEEAYSLALAARVALAERFEGLELEVLGTDADPLLLERARRGVYALGTLRELPEAVRAVAFERRGADWVLLPEYRSGVRFELHDVRTPPPAGPYDLIACRNLAFTYFDDGTQLRVARALAAVLMVGGRLVVGKGEELPSSVEGLVPAEPCIYVRSG